MLASEAPCQDSLNSSSQWQRLLQTAEVAATEEALAAARKAAKYVYILSGYTEKRRKRPRTETEQVTQDSRLADLAQTPLRANQGSSSSAQDKSIQKRDCMHSASCKLNPEKSITDDELHMNKKGRLDSHSQAQCENNEYLSQGEQTSIQVPSCAENASPRPHDSGKSSSTQGHPSVKADDHQGREPHSSNMTARVSTRSELMPFPRVASQPLRPPSLSTLLGAKDGNRAITSGFDQSASWSEPASKMNWAGQSRQPNGGVHSKASILGSKGGEESVSRQQVSARLVPSVTVGYPAKLVLGVPESDLTRLCQHPNTQKQQLVKGHSSSGAQKGECDRVSESLVKRACQPDQLGENLDPLAERQHHPSERSDQRQDQEFSKNSSLKTSSRQDTSNSTPTVLDPWQRQTSLPELPQRKLHDISRRHGNVCHPAEACNLRDKPDCHAPQYPHHPVGNAKTEPPLLHMRGRQSSLATSDASMRPGTYVLGGRKGLCSQPMVSNPPRCSALVHLRQPLKHRDILLTKDSSSTLRPARENSRPGLAGQTSHQFAFEAMMKRTPTVLLLTGGVRHFLDQRASGQIQRPERCMRGMRNMMPENSKGFSSAKTSASRSPFVKIPASAGHIKS